MLCNRTGVVGYETNRRLYRAAERPSVALELAAAGLSRGNQNPDALVINYLFNKSHFFIIH
jgi:hypothetical protein